MVLDSLRKYKNLVAAGFVLIHWVLVAIALAWRAEVVSSIHLYYESLLLQLILIADLPALLLLLQFGVEMDGSLMKITSEQLLLVIIAVSAQWFLFSRAIIWFFCRSRSEQTLK